MKDFRKRFYYDKNILEFLGITKKNNNNIIKNYHYQNKYFEILEFSYILSSKEKILMKKKYQNYILEEIKKIKLISMIFLKKLKISINYLKIFINYY